jgi:rod shape determining protein RodA
MGLSESAGESLSIRHKLLLLDWPLVALITAVACIGFAMLYSVGEGNFYPWADKQMLRFAIGLTIMIGVALTDLRVWLRIAYPAYFVALALVAAVEFIGTFGMGAQRWIDLGPIQLQPSEVMKIALGLALARYFHALKPDEGSRPLLLLPPALLVLMPSALVMQQPDLGTAALLILSGTALFFVAGVNWRYFAVLCALGLAAIPLGWGMLHDYQRDRILTFMDPARDPLGAGYHILQSKIALGSGGVFGKGFLAGTQSHLNFLPEKQTDFIFTTLGEEFGLVGGLTVLALYFLILAYALFTALQIRSQFGRLLAMSVCITFFLYVFINTAMVMGLIPVVGIPLPFMSYGGTAMMTLMIGFGLLMSASIHRDVTVPRYPDVFG